MQAQFFFRPATIAEVFGQAWNSGRITFSERQHLQFAFLNNSLSEDEYAAVDRLLHAVRRGWLQILD